MERYVTRLAGSVLAAVALWGCQETPTEPPTQPSAGRAAARTYTAVDLGTLGGACCSQARSINPRGQVVGSSAVVLHTEDGVVNEDHAVLWEKNGVMTDLGAGLQLSSFALAINPRGQVVGIAANPGEIDAVVWNKGVVSFLTPLSADPTQAWDINPAGQIVGTSAFHAVRWDNGVLINLDSDGTFRAAFGINPAGQVVGYRVTAGVETHAVLWTKGVMTDLGTLGGGFSVANDLNPAGQVVGSSSTTPGQFVSHAFLWANGVMTDLGTLGGASSSATAINPTGEVVGYSETATGETHAFLWAKGVMTDLGAGLGRESRAFGINPAGNVVGELGGHATLWRRKQA
jgi:probable HAF family extracellular repeat protein